MHNKEKIKQNKKIRRKNRIRSEISGTKDIPRLNVFKSNTRMYLQIIDDAAGKTIVSASIKDIDGAKGNKTEKEFELGKALAEKAKDKKVSKVVFDRGGNKYHGRVKSVADGAREGGLIF